MKTRFSVITMLFFLLLSFSCGRHKDMFVLQGTVPGNTDSILIVGLDSRFESVDTIFCHDGQFKWSFKPDTVTTLILVLQDGRRFPVFAEKDVVSTIVIPADSGLFSISGGYCNDSYQSFYLASQGDTAMEQTAARIDSFITRDPFSEVTPFLIYDQMVMKYHADQKDISKLILRMSGNMQDAPYLSSLTSEFGADIPNNVYISSLLLTDTAGVKYQFSNLGDTRNHLLVCVWSSWQGDVALKARQAMKPLLDKYAGRRLDVMDVSIDVNKESWEKMIQSDTVNWFSYIDTDGWESRIVKNSNVRQLPFYILFSGVKRVVYKTSSIEELDQELDKTLFNPERNLLQRTQIRP